MHIRDLRILVSLSLVCCLVWLAGCATPRWYKGNTHAHSLWSDGNDFPEMIVDWYRQRDYDFLCLSDHNILSQGVRWMDVAAVVKSADGDDVMTKYVERFGDEWVETRDAEGKRQVRLKTLEEFRPRFEEKGEFILVQAEEITDHYERRPVHINAINLRKMIPATHGDSVRDTMRNILRQVAAQEQITGEPILAHLNHPNFGWGITAEDLAHVLEEEYFEVYNGHPGVRHLGDKNHVSVERMWDIANTIRLGELGAPPLYGVATDDSHNYHGRKNVSPGRGWIMVRARELAAPALIRAMRKGDFYASSGVTLRAVRFDQDTQTLSIEIEPDGDAVFITQFIGTETGYDRASEPVTDAEGKPLTATRRYSADVGKVLATVAGTTACYALTGRELYVRAVVTSDKPADNPAFKNQRKQAWTQPVGWERHLRR